MYVYVCVYIFVSIYTPNPDPEPRSPKPEPEGPNPDPDCLAVVNPAIVADRQAPPITPVIKDSKSVVLN